MQNQPKHDLLLEPVSFTDSYPLLIHDQHDHPSREIVYLHRHNCLELGLCVKGDGIFVVEGKILTFSAGDFSVISPSEAHLATSSPGTTSHWIWFYFDSERILLPRFPEMDLNFLHLLRGGNFSNIFDGKRHSWGARFLEELFTARSEEEKTAWLLLMLTRLRKHVPATAAERTEYGGDFERIARAITYFGRKYAGPISIAEAARLCGMSQTNFRRIFKHETGESPLDYLNRLRISLAKAELRTGKLRISEIAPYCGFPSLSSFNRQFRKQTGHSPRTFLAQPVRPGADAGTGTANRK